MSYEDILEKRAAKQTTKQAAGATGKRGRKRKSAAPVAAKVKKTQRSEVEVAKDEIAAEGMEDVVT
jgi:hypothetical protein